MMRDLPIIFLILAFAAMLFVLSQVHLYQPVISIDCKKKELSGNFKNTGSEYAQKKHPVEVLDHDFPLPGLGKAAPYGIYRR